MSEQSRSKHPRSGYSRLKEAKAARKRGESKAERAQRFAPKARASAEQPEVPYHIHGLHAVRAALGNPRRQVHTLLATPNALQKLEASIPPKLKVETVHPNALDELLGADAVHQGVAALIAPLQPVPLTAPFPRFSLILDQVTDPHNVGAILRSAAAFNVDALITTTRHAARETATLAKAASGAFDIVPIITVRNLADALESLRAANTMVVGLDSVAETELAQAMTQRSTSPAQPVALVMGSEGKGLRSKTRETCDAIARLPVASNELVSLNVSNAAVLALYIAREHLDADPQ
ncbi:MAG: RNA methyltransferase [Pseudomonadota bacterium]